MELILSILLCVTLALIAVQDLKDRMVSWIILPVTAVLGYLLQLSANITNYIILLHTTYNVIFLILQLALLGVYFCVKGKNVFAIKSKIGLGDILFLFTAAFVLSFYSFLLFYISSLLFSMIVNFITIRKRTPAIPLAGLQAIFLMLVIAIQSITGNRELFDFIHFNSLA